MAALAAAGFAGAAMGGPRGPFRRPSSWRPAPAFAWPAVAAAGVYLVFMAPVIASGEATFLGYVKLDDTSTWLAFTDHVLTHGHSVAGLAPSSYEATVQINLSAGYPVGAFIPLAVGRELTATDPAWLFQPYLALMAALMMLVFFEVARPVLAGARSRALAAFVAAQPALLIGFAWWGGIKEVATALLAALFAAGIAALVRPGRDGIGRGRPPREAVPVPVIAGAALIGVMGAGGAPWLVAILLGGAILIAGALLAVARRDGPLPTGSVRRLGSTCLLILVGVAAIGLPTVFASGQLFSPDQGPLTSGEEMGNLIRPLSLAQYAGPWPAGDFRVLPDSGLLTFVLVAATVIAAVVGVAAAIRSRAWGLLLVSGGTGLGSAVVWAVGSPWVQGKALATGTASFLLLAMVGIAALLTGRLELRGSRALRAAGVILLIVPAGVIASNALAYHESWPAPRGQLAELERIGDRFAGQGPALMTEYQAYGVRHFLRRLDAEGASELRRRAVPRRDGTQSAKGAWSDTDELVLASDREGLFTYRTLVLRRNPSQSRPPSPYDLVWRGEFYEVWQRPLDLDPGAVISHVPLGGGTQPVRFPPCDLVRETAAKAGREGRVAAVVRDPNATAALTDFPADWAADPASGTLTPLSDGTADGSIQIPASGRYRVWVGGSARGAVEVSIGGVPAGRARGMLNNNGQFIQLGEMDLARGRLPVTLSYERGSALRPGVGAYPFGLGPVVIEPVADPELVELPASEADDLCRRPLDWIEALR